MQALEAELPHLRETAARPASAATAASPVAAVAVVPANADAASVTSFAVPAAVRPTAAPRLRFGRVRMSLAEYARSTLEPLLTLARRGRAALCTALPQEFELQRLAGPESGHFSAYYHPILHGSRTRQGRYQFPLYRRPSDAASQLTTAQILDGGLDGKGLELVYLDSLITAVNVHIEGSATVQFDDGSEVSWSFPSYGDGLPHDLVHLVLERRFGLRQGFWGRVAAGVDPSRINAMATRQGGKGKYAGFGEDLRELVLAEALAGAPWGMAELPDAELLAMLMTNVDAAGMPSPLPLTPELVAEVREALAETRRQWQAQGPKGALRLSFP